jgi:hypothetical protein
VTARPAVLKSINQTLWRIEDDIRLSEHAGEFGAHFIEQARMVYQSNDRCDAIKRRVNERLSAEIVEEKSYRAEESPGGSHSE